MEFDGIIENVDVIYGEFDIIAKVNSRNRRQLRNFVINNLRKLDEVKLTKKLRVVE